MHTTPTSQAQYTVADCEQVITQASRLFEKGSFAAAHILYRQANRAREIFKVAPMATKKVSSF
jgi:hypothetical protein